MSVFSVFIRIFCCALLVFFHVTAIFPSGSIKVRLLCLFAKNKYRSESFIRIFIKVEIQLFGDLRTVFVLNMFPNI